MGQTIAPVYPNGFVESVLKRPPAKWMTDEKYTIVVKLNLPNGKPPVMLVHQGPKKAFRCTLDEYKAKGIVPNQFYEWTPKTTMYDFEVYNESFDSVSMKDQKEIRIAKGEGLGVLIIEAADSYLKFIHSKRSTKYGMEVVMATRWRLFSGTRKCKQVLDNDTVLGYDICYLSGDKGETRTDIHMTRSPRPGEGEVWVPGLDKSLEKYEEDTDADGETKKSPSGDNNDAGAGGSVAAGSAGAAATAAPPAPNTNKPDVDRRRPRPQPLATTGTRSSKRVKRSK